MQRNPLVVDFMGMKRQRQPLGIRIPSHAPGRAPCLVDRLGQVERIVREQRPDINDPWVAAVLIVLGTSARG